MQPDVRLFLFDNLDCIEAIHKHTQRIKSYSDFMNSRTVYRAVEREIEIIAEALIRIKAISSQVITEDFQKIKGLRNRIVHAYGNVNHDIVWSIVKTDLLKLQEVSKALAANA